LKCLDAGGSVLLEKCQLRFYRGDEVSHGVEHQFVKIADHGSNDLLRGPSSARLHERRHQVDPRIQTHNAGIAHLANRFHQPVREPLHATRADSPTILPFARSVLRSLSAHSRPHWTPELFDAGTE